MTYFLPRELRARPYRPDAVTAEVPGLIEALESLGVVVPRADDLRRVTALQVTSPKQPSSVLDASDEELRDYAEEAAFYHLAESATSGIRDRIGHLVHQARREMQEVVRESADSLIEQLRPAFDVAADAARHLRARGVQPHDTAEDVLRQPREVIDAWLEFRARHAPTLTRILRVREGMSRTCGVPPVIVSPGETVPINYLLTMLSSPWPHPDYLPVIDPLRPDHERWLALAAHLHLSTSDEVSDLDHMRALGEDTTALEAVAAEYFAQAAAEPAALDLDKASVET